MTVAVVVVVVVAQFEQTLSSHKLSEDLDLFSFSFF